MRCLNPLILVGLAVACGGPDTDSDTDTDTDTDTQAIEQGPAQACASALAQAPVALPDRYTADVAFDGEAIWTAWSGNPARAQESSIQRIDCAGQALSEPIVLEPASMEGGVTSLVVHQGVLGVTWTTPDQESVRSHYGFFDATTGEELGGGDLQIPDAVGAYGAELLATPEGWFSTLTSGAADEVQTLHVLGLGPDQEPSVLPGASYPRQGWVNMPGQLAWDGQDLHLLYSEDTDDDWVSEVFHGIVGQPVSRIGRLDIFGQAGLFVDGAGQVHAHHGYRRLMVHAIGQGSVELLSAGVEEVGVAPVGDTAVVYNTDAGGRYCLLAELSTDGERPALGVPMDTRPGCPGGAVALGDEHVLVRILVDGSPFETELRAVSLHDLREQE